MHKLLLKQLARHFGKDHGDLPAEWRDFLDAVSASYADADNDRALTERSLEIASRELNEVNQALEQKIAELSSSTGKTEEKMKEMESVNTLMLDREGKMIELKEQIFRIWKRHPDVEDIIGRVPGETAPGPV